MVSVAVGHRSAPRRWDACCTAAIMSHCSKSSALALRRTGLLESDRRHMLYQAYQLPHRPDRSRCAPRRVARRRPTAPVQELCGRQGRAGASAPPGELMARAGLSHDRPAYGIDRVTVGNREVAVSEEPVLAHARSARCCTSARTSTRRSRGCCSWRRCPAISPPCCATRSARCSPTTTSTSPTGTTRATCRWPRGRSASTTTSST